MLFQPGSQRTVPNDDQFSRNAAAGGPIDHRSPGAEQRRHAFPGNQTGDRDATWDPMHDGSLKRPEAFDVDRRWQPQQSPARALTESAGNVALGVVGDRCEVITAVTNPVQQPACCGHPRPPGLVAMGETKNPPGTGTRKTGAANRGAPHSAEDHPCPTAPSGLLRELQFVGSATATAVSDDRVGPARSEATAPGGPEAYTTTRGRP